MKKNFIFMVLMTILAAITGDASVVLATATDLTDGGTTESGTNADNVQTAAAAATEYKGAEGIATETSGRDRTEDDDNPEFYQDQVDDLITKIRPMSTPIDQISRKASAVHTDSFVVKYYSVGTRPIVTATSAALSATSTTSAVLQVDDPTIFTVDDTIRVVGVKGYYKTSSSTVAQYANATGNPDLILCVCGRDSSTQNPIVYAVNGTLVSGQQIGIPAIADGTTLIRMAKACGELDMQTGRFDNLPTPTEQYCQNFMTQVEQSTFDKIASKEVNWTFSDLEEDAVYDMRLTQEASFLFGVKNKIKHVAKNNMYQWFTGGIWYQAGKDITIGTYNSSTSETTISDDDLVDMSKDLFVGAGTGNKTKILFCGSDLLAALSKIDSDKFRLKDTVEVWNLKFKSWQTDFGEILAIHHELFDQMHMAGYGFALDPAYLKKSTHINWHRFALDLKSAGVRNTEAVILQEVCALYLRYPNAHARVQLSGWTYSA